MRCRLTRAISLVMFLCCLACPVMAQSQVVVIEDSINLREGPSTDQAKIIEIPKGMILDVIDQSNSWYKVQYATSTGWVASWVVAPYQASNPAAAPVVSSNPNTTASSTSAAPPVILNGQPMIFEVAPVVMNGTVLVPIRAILEPIGAEFAYENNMVTIAKGNLSVVMVIGERSATIFRNGQNPEVVALESPATVINSRVLAPLRFVCETFGGSTFYDEAAQVIQITIAADSSTSSSNNTSSNSTTSSSTANGDFNAALASLGTKYDLKDYAQALIGVPYLYGGTSLAGFDCSGYTQYVFAHFAIALPRSAAEQMTLGDSIDFQSIKPGDLLFFYTTDLPAATAASLDGIDRSAITHVAIYAGSYTMLHSGNTGVTLSPLNTDYYIKRYAGARRLFNSLPEE